METKYLLSSRSAKPHTHRRNSVTSARAFKDIPRVQIFLDSQLKKAITKIQQESTIRNTHNSQHHRHDSVEQPQQQSIKLSSSRRMSQSSSIDSKKAVTFMSNDVVLSYIKEVYQKYGIKNPFEGYLDESQAHTAKQQFAFEKYPSFSDRKQVFHQPFEVQQSIRTHKKQRKISQNQARIFQLKNKFKQTIENEPFVSDTMKKTIKHTGNIPQSSIQQNSVYQMEFVKKSQGNITYIDRLTNLMQSQINDTYDFENDSTFNRTAHEQTPERSMKHMNKFYEQTSHDGVGHSPQVMKPKKRLFVKTRTTSTKYNEKQESPDRNGQMRVAFKMFELEPKEQKLDQSARHKTSIIKIEQSPSVVTSQVYENQHTIMASSLLVPRNQQIPQVYRYCLGCQTAILDSNVLFHQNKCDYLKDIAKFSISELYEILQIKIDRLKKDIVQSDLMNLQLKDVEEIREKASTILLKPNQDDQNQANRQNQANFREEFIKVNSLLSKKLLNGCEMIKKLQWFTKVRENLKHNHLSDQNSMSFQRSNVAKYQSC